MMPVYMDSYPHQNKQVSFPQYYRPSHNNFLPQMMVDQSGSPMVYDSWPHNRNYSMPFHGCCSHCNFQGYYGFGPAFSQFSPAPPFHCCRHYLSFPEPYPVYYAPTQHHGMDQQRYEYDENAHRDRHCCGCSNHMSSHRSDKGVKIEEQEPDAAKKSASFVPVQLKSYPGPIMWVPPEYMKETSTPFESELAEEEKVPRKENNKPSEEKPIEWHGRFPPGMDGLRSSMGGVDNRHGQNENGMSQYSHPIIWMPHKNEHVEPEKDQRKEFSWLPLDMNSIRSLMQGEDNKIKDNQQNDEQLSKFPHPIFLMPFKTEQGQHEKNDWEEMNVAPASAEESPSSSKIIQVKPSEIDNWMKNSEATKEIPRDQAKGSKMTEGAANQKIIPVKQVEARKEDNSDTSEKKVVAGTSGTSKKRQSLSPMKKTGLPPVCLRLEPLSKKKNGDSKARSCSPPSLKGRPLEDVPKLPASSCLKKNSSTDEQSADVSSVSRRDMDLKEGMQKPTDADRKEGLQRPVNMVDGQSSENKKEGLKSDSHMEKSIKLPIGHEEDVTGRSSMERIVEDSNGCDLIQDTRARNEKKMTAEKATEEKLNNSAQSVNGECKEKKRNLSDAQAAVLIQSAYRGFEVRKLESLQKLRQMAEVRHQIAEIRKRIQDLESSPGLQKNDKERVVIGEMIMGLLLKLDTIQGLHRSLRDVRKALAKDLVTLQEEIDSLMMKSEVTAGKVATDAGSDIGEDTGGQKMQHNAVAVPENSSVISQNNMAELKKQDNGKLSSMVDLVSNSQGMETSQSAHGDTGEGICEHEVREPPLTDSMESQVTESASDVIDDEATNDGVNGTRAVGIERQEEDKMIPGIPEEPTEVQLQDSCDDSRDVKEANVTEMNTGIRPEDNLEAESTESPLKLIDEEVHICALENDESAVKGKSVIAEDEVKSHVLVGPTLPPEDHYTYQEGEPESNADPETNPVADPPTEALKENLVVQSKRSGVDPETSLVEELPVEVLEEDKTNGYKHGKMDPETSLVAELSFGAIEEDGAVNEESEAGKDEVLSCGEEQCNLATNTTSPTESEDIVNIMEEELPGNAVLETEENPLLTSVEEETGSDVEVRKNESKDCGIVDLDRISSPESTAICDFTQVKGTKQDDLQQQVVDGDEMVVQNKPECVELDSVTGIDKMDEIFKSENTTGDSVAATPTMKTAVDESNIMTKDDRKLIEENGKLREMMEKLMEAGKEQLTVISQLNGRVKDLERKLSKKKKIRTPRRQRREITPSPSHRKLFNSNIAVNGQGC